MVIPFNLAVIRFNLAPSYSI